MTRAALTILELLVVIAVIALLIVILLPAVQSSREVGQRVQCSSNLKQLGIAMHNYLSDYGVFPPGSSNGFSLRVALLPYIDAQPIYAGVNFAAPPASIENATVYRSAIDLFLCPSDPITSVRSPTVPTSYAGNSGTGVQSHGYNGLFGILVKGGPIRPSAVLDGLSTTSAACDILPASGSSKDRLRTVWYTPTSLVGPDEIDSFSQLCTDMTDTSPTGSNNDPWLRGRPWIWGDSGIAMYNHVLGPNRNSCFNGGLVQEGAYSAGSLHKAGVNLLYADGRVAFITNDTDRQVWRAIGSRDGSETSSF